MSPVRARSPAFSPTSLLLPSAFADRTHEVVLRPTHSDPDVPVADVQPAWEVAGLDGRDDLVADGIDPGDGAVAMVRHPDRAGAHCDSVRPVTDLDDGRSGFRQRVDSPQVVVLEPR